MVMMRLGRLVVNLKSKLSKSLKTKNKAAINYDKIDKSDSMRVEIQSRKAQKIIQDTLKIADSPKSRTYAF